jgi:hypothetical protein
MLSLVTVTLSLFINKYICDSDFYMKTEYAAKQCD